MRTFPTFICLIATCGVGLVAASPAAANGSSSGRSQSGSLHTGTGGTGLSKGGGSGGTGLSSHGSASGIYKGVGAKTPTAASSPASNTQQAMVPAKPFTRPPAGVRPQTDLAAATKLIALSSAGLAKHSQLFPKLPGLPGDPTLSGPVLNSIGATVGGAASFKAVAGISANESNGNIYPSNGRLAPNKVQVATLWSGASSTVLASPVAADEARQWRDSGGWLLGWLVNAATLAGIGALSLWMWRQVPGGARMMLPARQAS